MTWIVGTPTMFGYGIGISDVRVTLSDGSEHDCLQKIYSVNQFVALGFAGSVRIGFAMKDVLSELLYSEDKSRAWDPTAVIQWWPRDAQEIFSKFPKDEQANQCHLLMVSVHPTEHSGNPDWPRSYVHIFKSPQFEPYSVPVHKIGAIGSGNYAAQCRDAISRMSENYDHMFQIMKGEQGTHGGMATMLGITLTRVLQRAQPRGVSAHLNYCWVYRKEVIIKTNNHATAGAWSAFETGSGIGRPNNTPTTSEEVTSFAGGAAFVMPRLATTWDELANLLHAPGAKADGCVA